MATKEDLTGWVVAALKRQGGRAKLIDVARTIWATHESELRASNDLFFTWQYDMRWSANLLRKRGIMKPAETSPSGVWEIAGT